MPMADMGAVTRTRRYGRATNKSPEDVPSPPVRLDATKDSLDGLLRPRARRRHTREHDTRSLELSLQSGSTRANCRDVEDRTLVEPTQSQHLPLR